jgi:hypothetical protein
MSMAFCWIIVDKFKKTSPGKFARFNLEIAAETENEAD